MIIPGSTLFKRNLVRGILASQVQPCGIDLSLRRVLRWTSAATIDFDNTRRKGADTAEMPFDEKTSSLVLARGAYLIEFNETVHIPLDAMGQLFVRSSLWRSGVTLSAGLVDAGYEGAMGGLLDVRNPFGITLIKNAKLGQISMHSLPEKVAGYDGIYQGVSSVAAGQQRGPKTKAWTASGNRNAIYCLSAWVSFLPEIM